MQSLGTGMVEVTSGDTASSSPAKPRHRPRTSLPTSSPGSPSRWWSDGAYVPFLGAGAGVRRRAWPRSQITPVAALQGPCQHEQGISWRPQFATPSLKRRIDISCGSAELEAFEDCCFLTARGWVMVLVLAALTGTAFGTGVIVGLAVGASSVACAYACREARRVGVEERPPGPRPEAREEQPRPPGGTKA
jgi:hypothetical protein